MCTNQSILRPNAKRMSEKVDWRLKSQLQEQNLDGAQDVRLRSVEPLQKVLDFSWSATADFVLIAAVTLREAAMHLQPPDTSQTSSKAMLRPNAKLSLGSILSLTLINPVSSQVIPNSAGTIVNQINITGGTQAGGSLCRETFIPKPS